MSQAVAIAVDLGASSGRLVAGQFDNHHLTLTELYRFENGPVHAAGTMHWDVLQQWQHIQHGLTLAAQQYPTVTSVGVDTWGVDFGLLGRGDVLLGNPVHYRDSRTDGALERAFGIVPRSEIFAHSGLQFMQINTLYQLLAMHWSNSPILEAAQSFLMMPDLFHWLLSGEKANEFSNATTSQFFDPRKHAWSTALFEKFGLPTRILQKVIEPGTTLGNLRAEVAATTGLKDTKVIVPGTHDTASAVLAVPAIGAAQAQPKWCYISSGTWSLMGVEIPEPVVNDRCAELNFTNEGGVGLTTRLLKNIAGLWLVQECRRIWKQQGTDYSWSELMELAGAATPLRSVINPDAAVFLAPANMPRAIQDYCQQTGQQVPETPGQIIRTALESLALKYRQVLGFLEQLTGGQIETIHIVGGGSMNTLLNQLAADATQRTVIAGPVEATAIGNLAMQYIAQGVWSNISEARQVIRVSFPVVEIKPQRNTGDWDAAAAKFNELPA
jgi:rhamnulokinase